MNWRQAAVLSLIVALASCAAEGGSRGSGIETLVEGNVVSVQTALARLAHQPTSGRAGLSQVEGPAQARTAVEGIRVAIEGRDIRDETDAAGNFSLRGDFEGDVTVVFELADGGGNARLAVNVPAAGTLTMSNVSLSPPTGEAVADTLAVEFDGIVVHSDCPGMTLTLVSAQQSPPDPDQYTVRLDTSSLQDSDGNPLSCEALSGGESATVQGLVNSDGTFGDATVQIEQ